MIKQRSSKIFILFLLAAFLVVKWTPSHAHLNVQHDHGDEQHPYSVETHAHQPSLLHTASIDSQHSQLDEAMIVGLGHEQTPSDNKKPYHPLALAAVVYCPSPAQARGIGLSTSSSLLPRLLHQHPGQPRAPPQLS